MPSLADPLTVQFVAPRTALPAFHGIFDPGLESRQAGLVGDSVLQRVPVLVDPGFLQDRSLPRLDNQARQLCVLRPQLRQGQGQPVGFAGSRSKRVPLPLQLQQLSPQRGSMSMLPSKPGRLGAQRTKRCHQLAMFMPQPR